MAKVMTPKEIERLRKKGAEVEYEKEPPKEVEGMADIVNQLSKIANATEMSAERQREELKDTLEKLVNALESREKTDLTPLTTLLGRIAMNTQPEVEKKPCVYEHEIKRNSRGDMVGIKSVPKQEKMH